MAQVGGRPGGQWLSRAVALASAEPGRGAGQAASSRPGGQWLNRAGELRPRQKRGAALPSQSI